jgi:NAD(P)-dependent dehydrogenase (short-subunit alcohol dehydrogenase family)
VNKPHCIVIGVGPGTGLACAKRFAAEGYVVSMIARHQGRMDGFVETVAGSTGHVVDIADINAYRACLGKMVADHGVPKAVIYNATIATFGRYDEIEIDQFELSYRVNTSGLLVTAQVLAPLMAELDDSSIVVTGNTGSQRGKPNFIGWSPSKAAQRILAEALARELGPSGIHVAYVVIDAVIDMPFARKRMGEHPDEFFAKPDDLAGEIFHVAHQPKSARSFLVELRPFAEKW